MELSFEGTYAEALASVAWRERNWLASVEAALGVELLLHPVESSGEMVTLLTAFELNLGGRVRIGKCVHGLVVIRTRLPAGDSQQSLGSRFKGVVYGERRFVKAGRFGMIHRSQSRPRRRIRPTEFLSNGEMNMLLNVFAQGKDVRFGDRRVHLLGSGSHHLRTFLLRQLDHGIVKWSRAFRSLDDSEASRGYGFEVSGYKPAIVGWLN